MNINVNIWLDAEVRKRYFEDPPTPGASPPVTGVVVTTGAPQARAGDTHTTAMAAVQDTSPPDQGAPTATTPPPTE